MPLLPRASDDVDADGGGRSEPDHGHDCHRTSSEEGQEPNRRRVAKSWKRDVGNRG